MNRNDFSGAGQTNAPRAASQTNPSSTIHNKKGASMRTTQNRFRKQGLVRAGGVAALTALAGAAEAVPIYSGLQNTVLSGVGNTLNLDLNGDSTNDISFATFSFGSTFQVNAIEINSTTIGSFIFNKANYTTRFADGSIIGVGTLQSIGINSALFYSQPGLGSAWNSTTPAGYLGFHLSGGEYGWMYISSVSNSLSSSITIRDWAYEDVPDAAITAGAGIPTVPEPGTAALMLGAGAALALKRLRSRS
jgi:hypothetical protein